MNDIIPLDADHVNVRQRRNNAIMIQAQATMRRIGLELIHEKRQTLADQMTATREGKNKETDGFTTRLSKDVIMHVAEPGEKESLRASTPPNEVLNSKGLGGKDLLSVLSECFNPHPHRHLLMTSIRPHSQIQHVFRTFPTNERRRSFVPDLDFSRSRA